MLKRFVAPMVPALLILAAQLANAQQQAAAADSNQVHGGPTAQAAHSGVDVAHVKKRDRLPVLFYGILGAGAVASRLFHVDPDTGGYRDGWTTSTTFPDKAVHGLAAWAITSAGVDLGVRPAYSATAVCAAGTAFEFAQGYVSVYDIAADCVGAAGAAAWRSWRARRRAKAAPR